MKYTAEEVRAMAKMVGDEFSPHAGSMLTAYAERIKADEMGVSAPKRQYYYRVDGCTATDATDPTCICWHDEGTGPLAHGDYLPKSWRGPPAQPAQPVDVEKVREVIARVAADNQKSALTLGVEGLRGQCIETAKELHKLTAALQEKGNG